MLAWFKNARPATKAKVAGGATGALMLLLSFIPGMEGKTNEAIIPVPDDVPTICYGYTKGVKMGDKATDEECIQFLRAELDVSLAVVDRLIHVKISEGERAAYGSAVYNLGSGEIAKSSMVRKANAGDRLGACNALARKSYDKNGVCHGYGCGWAKGRMYKGLQRRREAERQLCLKGFYSAEIP